MSGAGVRSASPVSYPELSIAGSGIRGGCPRVSLLVACPKVEINANGGLPSRVRELTNPRHRLQHFTGCHKPYLVIFLEGENADARRDEIQKWLSWSGGL